jgi:circadian clock protein KaiC
MKPVKTGIPGLDEFLLGGLTPRIILLSGVPGSGNELFARQVLFNSVKQCTSEITYFTVNASTESVREDMAAYGWDTVPFEKEETWKFKNLRDTDAKELSEAILSEMAQQRTVAVDSLSELLLTHKTKEMASLITAMTRQNSKTCQHYHLLLLTEGMQDAQTETTINHFVEGSIYFDLKWAADTTMRHLVIRKLSGTIVPSRKLNYNLGKKGIVIETATRIT